MAWASCGLYEPLYAAYRPRICGRVGSYRPHMAKASCGLVQWNAALTCAHEILSCRIATHSQNRDSAYTVAHPQTSSILLYHIYIYILYVYIFILYVFMAAHPQTSVGDSLLQLKTGKEDWSYLASPTDPARISLSSHRQWSLSLSPSHCLSCLCLSLCHCHSLFVSLSATRQR